ncbi:DUF3574 domain-containing protein [Burkholderia ubonensis]|uniref:DUF3574 domain-containing protein n=1 Tax=Burkholderia ubonensis TaxID=101571 RepID=UPI000F57F145|nr:DUF3574 domain-containing protein [Burkholderia ubonensis]RQP37127.1 DUF3574 domain-containing protein [Burkholderia ubonensis]RQP43466.1 DUF3574 domain-containing protein [Burkholderia ubonensis]RQP46250.1 DUF3574 domain-containing protein [Burkholderia ubonensis]RQP59581.1 DUF3574 domain-containing protein [Burkholderia ubonensis]RQP65642.1 DUF3574 domain-containing protein [Burkholderia ubonensis]
MRSLSTSLAFSIALLSGCAATQPPSAGEPAFCAQAVGSRQLQADLLFGRDIAGRGPVTDAERAAFLSDVVTPRFPDGFTSWDTRGQWRDRATGRITREDSFVVRIVADDTRERLSAIRRAYVERFKQDAVGVTLAPTCASF